jgi:hypothetical protein
MNKPIIIGQVPHISYIDIANELAELLPDNQVTIVNRKQNDSWLICEIRIDN